MKKSKGFTLIELMICIAIVGVLATIALGSREHQKDKDNTLQISIGNLKQKLVLDPDQCFDEFKVEKARRDSAGTLYCFKDGEWQQSFGE